MSCGKVDSWGWKCGEKRYHLIGDEILRGKWYIYLCSNCKKNKKSTNVKIAVLTEKLEEEK